MVNLTKKAVGAEGGMLVDISSASSYFTSKDAAITEGSQESNYQNVYTVDAYAQSPAMTDSGYIRIDITSLISEFAHPTVYFPVTFLSMGSYVGGNYVSGVVDFLDKNDSVIAHNEWIWRGSPAGFTNMDFVMNFLYADLTSYKNDVMAIYLEGVASGSAGNMVNCSLRIPSYLMLFDAEM